MMTENQQKITLIRLAALALVFVLVCGCGLKANAPETAYLFAMDTIMTCTVYGENADAAISAAWEEIKRAEALLSKTDPSSAATAVNAAGINGAEISEETASLIKLALEYAALTDGAFDITIGHVMDAWGFSGENPAVPDASVLSGLLGAVGSEHVKITGNTVTLTKPGTAIDLGGVGKGYAAGLAACAARENGIESAFFSLGGNVIVVGEKPGGSPWIVAVKDPRGGDGYIGRLSVRDTSAVTSGGYERFFEQDGKTYHHIIDPKTGYPADSGLLSVTVVCEDWTVADILSTAVFVMGEEKALDFWRERGGFGLVLVTDENEVVVTGDIAGIFEFTGGDAGYIYSIYE